MIRLTANRAKLTAGDGWAVTSRFRRQRGIASVEFALVATLLLYLMFAVVQFAWLLNNYAKLDTVTAAAARYFAAQVGSLAPRTNTITNFGTLMSGMEKFITGANLTVVTSVAGTACSTDTACAAALLTASKVVINPQGTNWADQRVTVAVTWNIAGDPKKSIFTLGGLGLGSLVPAQRVFAASVRVTVAQ